MQVKTQLVDVLGRPLSVTAGDSSVSEVGPIACMPDDLAPVSFMLPVETNTDQLNELARTLLLQAYQGSDDDERERIGEQIFSFSVSIGSKILPFEDGKSLSSIIPTNDGSEELTIKIIAAPQALFRVRPATRCTGTLEGHTDAVLSVAFSADGHFLASGSGDCTIRIWDVRTGTTVKSLKAWVMAVTWSPDGTMLASGAHDSSLAVWHMPQNFSTSSAEFPPSSTPAFGSHTVLRGHSAAITQLAWQPLHLADPAISACLLASASKDKTVRIWNPKTGVVLQVLSQHSELISSVRWSGSGVLFTGSRDRLIHTWRWAGSAFQFSGSLKGHAHWINHMALSTDALFRTGDRDAADLVTMRQAGVAASFMERIERAKAIYQKHIRDHGAERLISSSDDATLMLWCESQGSWKLVKRLVGHQGLVTQALFSPDTNWIASCSFDKSVKLWDARSGEFIASLRGHLSSVYQLAWSADSRMLLSSSKDSTVIIWSVAQRKMKKCLSGHRDEVYAVDWASDGQTCASGSKDHSVKLWRN